MRLIDAKQTKREITKYLEECIDNNKIEIDVTELQIRIFGIINNQPTAYDTEAVVAELEKEKYIAEKEMEECIFKALPYHDSIEGKWIGINKAIEIVRKGGM